MGTIIRILTVLAEHVQLQKYATKKKRITDASLLDRNGIVFCMQVYIVDGENKANESFPKKKFLFQLYKVEKKRVQPHVEQNTHTAIMYQGTLVAVSSIILPFFF